MQAFINNEINNLYNFQLTKRLCVIKVKVTFLVV